MYRKLTQDQGIFLSQIWWKHDRRYATVIEMFLNQFPGVKPPTHWAIYKSNKRSEQSGYVSDLPRSCQPTAVENENLQTMVKVFVASPVKSIRRASTEFGIA
jgi:hypothetical protein